MEDRMKIINTSLHIAILCTKKNALLTAITMHTNSLILTKSECFLVGEVILRSETNFTTTYHIASIHFMLISLPPKKCTMTSPFWSRERCYFSFFFFMYTCWHVFTSANMARETGPTLETELQRFVTAFIRSSLHSLWSALEKARSLLPKSNHIASRVPLCQNCSM